MKICFSGQFNSYRPSSEHRWATMHYLCNSICGCKWYNVFSRLIARLALVLISWRSLPGQLQNSVGNASSQEEGLGSGKPGQFPPDIKPPQGPHHLETFGETRPFSKYAARWEFDEFQPIPVGIQTGLHDRIRHMNPYYNLRYHPSAPFIRSGFLVSYRIRLAMKFSQNVLHYKWNTSRVYNPYKVCFEVLPTYWQLIERIKQNGDLSRRLIM